MKETSKLNNYRIKNNYFKYFQGKGIDIGAGDDLLSKNIFTGIESISGYDIGMDNRNDGLRCLDIADDTFDFVYSSHCLEHMEDPYVAFKNWIRICKTGGHIVFAVPHEIFYEKCRWPSLYNTDHKTSWTYEFKSNLPNSINILDFVNTFKSKINIININTLLYKFDFNNFMADQTCDEAICQIECIVQKI